MMSFDWLVGMTMMYWIEYGTGLHISIHANEKQYKKNWAAIKAISQTRPNHLICLSSQNDHHRLLTTKSKMKLHESKREIIESGIKNKKSMSGYSNCRPLQTESSLISASTAQIFCSWGLVPKDGAQMPHVYVSFFPAWPQAVMRRLFEKSQSHVSSCWTGVPTISQLWPTRSLHLYIISSKKKL